MKCPALRTQEGDGGQGRAFSSSSRQENEARPPLPTVLPRAGGCQGSAGLWPQATLSAWSHGQRKHEPMGSLLLVTHRRNEGRGTASGWWSVRREGLSRVSLPASASAGPERPAGGQAGPTCIGRLGTRGDPSRLARAVFPAGCQRSAPETEGQRDRRPPRTFPLACRVATHPIALVSVRFPSLLEDVL